MGAPLGVRLSDGEIIRAETVTVGIGIVPAVEPLLHAGLKGGNGVAVDAQWGTSVSDIFAIGDRVLHTSVYAAAEAMRLEYVQNASDQAAVVAKVLTGAPARYDAVPWFGSDQ